MRKWLSIILFAAALAALAAAAAQWQRGAAGLATLSERRAGLATDLDSTRARLYQTSLRYQGFQRGQAAVPDSIRRAQAKTVMDQAMAYRKAVFALETKEKELERSIRKLDTRAARDTTARRNAALPFVAAGVVLLAAAGVLFANARSRRVAP
jgi:hypothetical protein